ncbi:hypothetical protein Pint_14796 [Pistacia integerrima]|uniref:Uncharacterized protein n=1 Tax=Pistacia integerrima TaxID=434235 RepID=A0ACC0ZDZ0_9ROSI|nr:hypothetical protein Pint_14796 [Pistacia integerrima]
MNSMFSSFDAFSAEFLGQKVRASFVSATKKVNNMQSESKDSTRVNKNFPHGEEARGWSVFIKGEFWEGQICSRVGWTQLF